MSGAALFNLAQTALGMLLAVAAHARALRPSLKAGLIRKSYNSESYNSEHAREPRGP